MVKYHGRGKGKFYSLSDPRSTLHTCQVTWKATSLARAEPYFSDDKVSRTVLDRAFFLSIRSGRVCHRVGPEFVMEPANPYRFSRRLGNTPTVPGLNDSTREMVDLFTGLKFWRLCILSRARQTVTFPGDATFNSPPVGYKSWLNKLFSSEASHCSPWKHGKGKRLPAGMRSSPLVFKSSGSSKRKHSLDSVAEDRDPKHARGARKETFSSCGPRVVPLTHSSPQRVLVPSSTPLVIPENVVREPEVESILRAGASSLWSRICTWLKERSPELVLKEEEDVMSTFQALTWLGLREFPNLCGKLEGFFRKAREAGTTLSVASQDNTTEASCKLVLLIVSSEDLALKRQCKVQKAKELEQEVAELEARARDLRVELRSKGPLLLSLILKQLILPRRFIPWRKRSEQNKPNLDYFLVILYV
ncbi:hypothetical protein LIER_24320 [Lithospermum erythrorhizon]|uniref:Uncharacterized protein n=1 Tax=Lithospermum erythrorhizon TaxID=34254 RepID=A0AAV3R241_LITER